MSIEPMAEFKSRQRETWTMGNFGDMAVFTTPVAGRLVRYAGVKEDHAVPALTPRPLRLFQEAKTGPFIRTVEVLQTEPARLAAWRSEMEEVLGEYLQDNIVRHEYLLTRAVRV